MRYQVANIAEDWSAPADGDDDGTCGLQFQPPPTSAAEHQPGHPGASSHHCQLGWQQHPNASSPWPLE
jgi:hypothetical protein